MTIEEIKAAVDAGKHVRWSNDGYHVTKGRDGQYLITFQPNQNTIGLPAWVVPVPDDLAAIRDKDVRYSRGSR